MHETMADRVDKAETANVQLVDRLIRRLDEQAERIAEIATKVAVIEASLNAEATSRRAYAPIIIQAALSAALVGIGWLMAKVFASP